MKKNDPDRGKRIGEKRAEARAQAYKFGRIAPGNKPVALTYLVAKYCVIDRACNRCGAPTIWGACAICTPQIVAAPGVILAVVKERLAENEKPSK
jgi:hypothetical protein